MTDIVPASSNKLDKWNDSGPWYEGTHGERIAVRLSSLDTNGAYAIVESIAAPGCATPMHLHRNEAEHFVIIAGSYRIAIGEKIFEASAGASITLPKGVPHSWAISPASPGAW
jgi:mannose-6-phosphate isomerase-like protein (cupin superfamily)